jgi:hypothetical protein
VEERSMKSDDPRLKVNLQQIAERSKLLDELRVAVIKGHVVMEEALDSFLEAALPNPEQLEQLRPQFRVKGYLALSLALGADKDEVWPLFWAVTELRNKIAHKIDSNEIDPKMKYVRTVYTRFLSPQEQTRAEKLKDSEIAMEACQYCAGFLATIADDARARRAIIKQHWKPSR